MSYWKVLKLHAGQKWTFLAFENDTFFKKYLSDDIETNFWVSKATLSKLCKLNIFHEKIALKLTFGQKVQAFENSSFWLFLQVFEWQSWKPCLEKCDKNFKICLNLKG